jgi:glycerol-3-phosphate acyltransferase PlsX
MRIVLDAMGTDKHPTPDVEGAILAAREWADEIVLVGDESQVQAELDKHDTNGLKLTLVHASQMIARQKRFIHACGHGNAARRRG